MTDSNESEPLISTPEGLRYYMLLRFWAAVSVLALACALWSVHTGWRIAERQGWVAQTRPTAVNLDGEWMVGGYRDCVSKGIGGPLNCPEAGKSVQNPLTNPIPERVFSVAFWGDTGKDSKKTSLWHCKRERDRISCHLRS